VAASLEITTPRLLLRPFRESDLDDLTRLNADPQVMRYLGNGKPMTRAESWRQIATFLGHQQMRGYSILAIEERSTGQFLGRSGPWFPVGWPMLEVGWGVVPERQGEGVATEAGRASLDWCFANLGVDRVCSLIRSQNAPSIRVAEKLGATLDHQLEEFLGEPADVWVHRPAR
jgi:RimJ/RimL family protein N-acetyltransferase